MLELMKHTYLFDLKAIKKDIDMLWNEYLKIVESKNTTWEQINKARAINYFMHIYVEKIAVEMIKRRLNVVSKISVEEFLIAADSDRIKENKTMIKLAEYYKIIKEYKNKIVNGSFHNEEIFLKKYEELKPADFI